MDIGSLNNKTASLYLQFLTGNKNAKTVAGLGSSSSTGETATISTPNIDKAMASPGKLSQVEQQGARRELKALILNRLFSIKIDV